MIVNLLLNVMELEEKNISVFYSILYFKKKRSNIVPHKETMTKERNQLKKYLLKYGYKLMFFNLQFMIGISINIL
jgi:predicted RNA methylase